MKYQIFLFLRWVGRVVFKLTPRFIGRPFYKFCSKLSNKIYKVPEYLR